ncbi:MAG: Phosphoribosyl-dephospho-CoA transferase [Candidatus Gallionella acididurans]|uniref:Phosphoribosyl-dephospho-CoA transferase n=1 Tax=Candidatus Gallionella acididurans TaxID=1796491 RepID=A0A139BW08_9PROT|nr:MAG: Phosphoribosyl-dephospho-CoA transferase [Candidatus Gallionella acididurans]
MPESAQPFVPEQSGLCRHSLVWMRPNCHAAVAAQVKDGATHTQVAAWLAADRPLVVARQPCGAALPDAITPNSITPGTLSAGTISTGLALPPAPDKRRIALVVAAHEIARHTQPLLLADAIAHATVAWQPALAELHDAAINIGIKLRVFGSLAWQALSGLQYLTPHSDIDLLWNPLSHAQLQQGIALLARWEQEHGLRADGEVLFGASSAVSWREWAALRPGGNQRVLVKRDSGAELVVAGELLELLA